MSRNRPYNGIRMQRPGPPMALGCCRLIGGKLYMPAPGEAEAYAALVAAQRKKPTKRGRK